MEDLAGCRQAPSENVLQFYFRLEKLVSKLVNAAIQNNLDPGLIPTSAHEIYQHTYTYVYGMTF